MYITLKDGSVMSFDGKPTVAEVTRSISDNLYRNSVAARLDENLVDLTTRICENCNLEILTVNDNIGRTIIVRSLAFLLAKVIKELFPDTLLGGFSYNENGFYYDFEFSKPILNDSFPIIENKVQQMISDASLSLVSTSSQEIMKIMEDRGESYRVEVARDTTNIYLYKSDEFYDFTSVPLSTNFGAIKFIKIISATGAYWKSNSKNKMLTRVLVRAFEKKSQLEQYMKEQEAIKNRDHNRVGRLMEIFTTVDFIGQGLPIMLPNGSRILQLLQRFVEDEEQKRGYQLLTGMPLMAKRELYKISGHWDHYRDSMFVFGDPNTWDDPDAEVLALRPMACPFQFMAYNNKMRSFRDLPIKYGETATMFRNEDSGEMHGLIRVRQFTISEGHIMCMPSQVEQQFKECVELIKYMQKTIGLDDSLSFRFSKWDENNKEKYIGSADDWERTQNSMRAILDHLGLIYTEADGEAAFYGPKLDVQVKNVYGKEDTLCTVQIDFQLAERYGMFYTDSDGTKKHPIIIHRTSIGCYQRVLALLIEKYNGAFPTWLSPVQVKVLNLPGCAEEYVKDINDKLLSSGIRVVCDNRNEKIGKKIRDAQLEKVPYMIIVGENEVANHKISVRARKEGELGVMELEQFIERIIQEVHDKTLNV